MHGTVAAVTALQKSDLLITLGARFDDRVTGQLSTFAPRGQGHPRRHRPGRDLQEPHRRRADRRRLQGRHHRARSPPCGAEHEAGHDAATTTAWRDAASWTGRRTFPLGYTAPEGDDGVAPAVRHRAASGAISAARSRSTSPASASTRCGPRSSSSTSARTAWLNSGGLGTMGYAVPAAMGAKVGRAGPHGLGDRRRRLLPDDQPGAGDLRHQRHPDQGRDHQQLQPGHGPPVADAVLRRALLQHRPAHLRRPPGPRLRQARRRLRLRRAAVRAARGRRRHDRARRWRSTTCRSSSTSSSTATRWSGRWSPAGVEQRHRSSSPAA